MKKLLLVSILIAVLAGFFASSHPDGLDFVSEKLGFSDRGQERAGLPYTPLTGAAGIVLVLAVFWLTVYLLKNKRAGVLLLVLLAAAPSFAARPLTTDDFGTVAPGRYEVEAGYLVEPGSALAAVQVKTGVTDNFDFGVEIPHSLTAPGGMGDTVLHAKYKMLDRGEEEGLGARLDIKLANADAASGLGSGFVDYSAVLIYSRPIAGYMTHYNLAYTLVGTAPGSASANQFSYAAAAETAVYPGVEAAGEFWGAAGSANFLLGARWQALETVRLDAGYSLALNTSSSNAVTLGLTAEL